MKKLDRKTVEIKKVRIPLRKLLHGQEIRVASKNLEDFRLKLLEEEFMLGAKLTVKMEPYGEAILIATRLETDKEFAERLEKARIAAEKKAKREKIRQLYLEEKAKRDEENRKKNIAKTIRDMVKANSLTMDELNELLKAVDKT